MSQALSRLEAVREALRRAALEVGRSPDAVRLIGVTKTVPWERIAPLVEAGLQDLGENYVQEARDKAGGAPGVRWHLLGHLQKNKVNAAVDLFDVIHSLDDLALVRRLDRRCQVVGRICEGLVQVRLGGEPGKGGLDPEALLPWLDELAQEPPARLRLAGLMSVPPPVASAEENRLHFRRLRRLLEEVQAQGYPFWSGGELSMGMSDDFLVAVQEGATMVRVGRALFGAR